MTNSASQHLAECGREYFRDLDKIHKLATTSLVARANRRKSAGGLLPVDSGDLVRSVTVNGRRGEHQWRLGVSANRALTAIEAVWDVSYSGFVEGGTSTKRAQPFVRNAIMSWGGFVDDADARIRG